MENTYILGGPALGHITEDYLCKDFFAPFGQLNLCHDILKETQDREKIIENLAREYLAIVYALKEMDIRFYITYSAKAAKNAENLLSICQEALKCKFIGLPENFPFELGCYPRDMLVYLKRQKTVLVNSSIANLNIKNKDLHQFFPSPYGEGGRVLFSDEIALISKQLVSDNSRVSHVAESGIFKRIELKVSALPVPLSGVFSLDGIKEKVNSNDHLDRVSNLVKGKDGNLHLIIDPNICTLENDGKKEWLSLGPKKSKEKIISYCEPLGIKVHYPKKMEIPYSINFEQFPDRRVLVTKGEKYLNRIIGRIVGWENIFTTEVPIRFLPVYNRAGIRCMVNQIPEPMIKTLIA